MTLEAEPVSPGEALSGKLSGKSKRNFLPCTGSFDSAGRHSNPAVVSQFYCKSHKVDDTASLFPY